MKIDDTAPQSQKLVIQNADLKLGNKSKFEGEATNTGCEGEKQIKEVHKGWVALTSKFENEFLHLNHKEGKRSLIFEYLFHILRSLKPILLQNIRREN